MATGSRDRITDNKHPLECPLWRAGEKWLLSWNSATVPKGRGGVMGINIFPGIATLVVVVPKLFSYCWVLYGL